MNGSLTCEQIFLLYVNLGVKLEYRCQNGSGKQCFHGKLLDIWKCYYAYQKK